MAAGPVPYTYTAAHLDRCRPRRTGEGPPHVLVIHTSEQPFPDVTSAERLAAMIAGPKGSNGNVSSYHWCVDVDSTHHMVPVEDLDRSEWIAFHAPPNWRGEAICLTGRAGRDWTGDTDGFNDWPQLELAARLAAWRLTARGWPPVKLTPADVQAGRSGMCGHVDISAAFGQTDHTDPGRGFPWDWFVARVAALMAPPLPPPPPPDPPSEEDTDMLTTYRDARFNNVFQIGSSATSTTPNLFASLTARGVPHVVDVHDQALICYMRQARLTMREMVPSGASGFPPFLPPADLIG